MNFDTMLRDFSQHRRQKASALLALFACAALPLVAQDVITPTATNLGILGDDTSELTLDTVGSSVGDTELGIYDAAGTDPLDGDSFFEIILLTRAAVTELVTVTWSSIPGRSYTLQKSVDLSPGSWDNIATGIIATGATTSRLDPSADDQSRMFYRVGVE
jgi:hypothetical protein